MRESANGYAVVRVRFCTVPQRLIRRLSCEVQRLPMRAQAPEQPFAASIRVTQTAEFTVAPLRMHRSGVRVACYGFAHGLVGDLRT